VDGRRGESRGESRGEETLKQRKSGSESISKRKGEAEL
jgi:hypothetical protein